MILLIGSENDYCISGVQDYLRDCGHAYYRADGARAMAEVGVNWSLPQQDVPQYLMLAGQQVPLDEITGVLARGDFITASIRKGMTPENESYVRNEWQAMYVGLLKGLSGVVINRPVPGYTGVPLITRLPWLNLLPEFGLQMPHSLITSSSNDAFRFYETSGQDVVLGNFWNQYDYRRLQGSSGRQQLGAEIERMTIRLHAYHPEQLHWQIFVVGTQVFATAGQYSLETGRWNPGSGVAAPENLCRSCVDLVAACKLVYACLSVSLDDTGTMYCYDMQDMPILDNCDDAARHQIIGSLGRTLAEKTGVMQQ